MWIDIQQIDSTFTSILSVHKLHKLTSDIYIIYISLKCCMYNITQVVVTTTLSLIIMMYDTCNWYVIAKNGININIFIKTFAEVSLP